MRRSFADGVNAMNAPYDNVSAMNITAELNIYYALPLYGYIMPLLLVVTIVANTLIVMVLSKRHMRTPTNTVYMNTFHFCSKKKLLVEHVVNKLNIKIPEFHVSCKDLKSLNLVNNN